MTGEIAEATTPSAVGARTRPVRHFELGLSETPSPPLPSVLAALHEQMARANRYPEFLPQRLPRIIAVDLIRRYPNVLVLRTFSKAFGLAGLRIGYAFGARELVARVRRRQLPFGMSCAAVAAVTASYAAEDELRARVARITTERERLRVALRQIGVHVPRSHANFLYLSGPRTAAALQRAGIVAKPYPDGSARIAVGDPAAGRAVLRALRAT
ncbi:aminotransferase class I/II-fold pyridoxal phosphate-dependent enzyme [Rhodococcus koreensis]